MQFYLSICYISVAIFYVKSQEQQCRCNLQGIVNSSSCINTTSICNCLPGYIGEFCQQCDQGFFQLYSTSVVCQSCGCHSIGAYNNTCDSNGVCNCYGNWIGDKCDECANGYFNLSGTCIQCQCNNNSKSCNKTTGVCTNCENYTTGDHCQLCLPGYYHVNNLCTVCDESSPSSVCFKTTIQPGNNKTVSITHDFISPVMEERNTSITSATQTPVNSSVQTTSSDGTSFVSPSVPLTNLPTITTSDTNITLAGSIRPTDHTETEKTIQPTTASISKRKLGVILGVVLSLTFILLFVIIFLVYLYWVKPRRRLFRSPLWTIELRRDEDDTLFNDLQTIDSDVLYLDDAYLMDKARVYNKVTTENSRYHPLG